MMELSNNETHLALKLTKMDDKFDALRQATEIKTAAAETALESSRAELLELMGSLDGSPAELAIAEAAVREKEVRNEIKERVL